MAMEAVSAETLVLVGLCAVAVSVFFRKFWNAKSNGGNLPPLCAGWLPWIGCAVEFGKAPVHFIEQKRKEMGSVYTLLVAGERMTFLLDPDDFHHFFQSPNVDFQRAVQAHVQKVACVTPESFFTYHTKIHDMVKGKLAATKLSSLFASLNQGFSQGLDQLATGDHELHEVVRDIMYRSVLDNLFGKGTLPTTDEAGFKELERHFVMFDDQFEYGSKLPPFFLREWSSSRAWLLRLFGRVSEEERRRRQRQGQGQGDGETETETVHQSLLDLVDEGHAPNYSLLLMWASLANAIPIMFWTLALIFSNEKVTEKARQEVIMKIGATGSVSEDALGSLTYLKSCILEAIRLRSPGVITRRVMDPVVVKGMTVPAGDMLMVSPLWAHRNPRFFPDPDEFVPERWERGDVERNVFLEGFIAFGGGRYQCPGRWFALLELQLFLALFLQRLDCRLRGPVPELSPLHLVGTPLPVGPCPVHLNKL
ncbi:24-hydroxycholesterol 7-alpha-hydroxylase-like [Babylonia areolata]|uniref:24-hydroxycholesterol 7-alpha-hydroxylase-like n=1 Tax=Babylonia areolata TaxID=304850 RepID=UPI003FD62C2F